VGVPLQRPYIWYEIITRLRGDYLSNGPDSVWRGWPVLLRRRLPATRRAELVRWYSDAVDAQQRRGLGPDPRAWRSAVQTHRCSHACRSLLRGLCNLLPSHSSAPDSRDYCRVGLSGRRAESEYVRSFPSG